MIAELSASILEHAGSEIARQRLIGIGIAARSFEDIASGDFLSTEISRLAGNPAKLLELVVIRFHFGEGDAEILHCHVSGNDVAAVFLGVMRPHNVIRFQPAPCRAVPVRTRASDIVARQE